MLGQLLESRQQRQKSVSGTIVSIVFHTAVIGVTVWATANAAVRPEPPQVETIAFVNPPRQEPPPPPQQPDLPSAVRDVVIAPPAAKGFQVLKAPIDVPNVIPDVDLSRAVTSEADFSGKGVAGGRGNGVVGGTGTSTTNHTYFISEVEIPAALDRDRSPRPDYPRTLRDAGITGRVRAQFVVDTTGHAEAGSLKILSSPNELFSNSVRNVLPKMRFFPAETGGRKVRQLVEQEFMFKID
jgi:protein TonB